MTAQFRPSVWGTCTAGRSSGHCHNAYSGSLRGQSALSTLSSQSDSWFVLAVPTCTFVVVKAPCDVTCDVTSHVTSMHLFSHVFVHIVRQALALLHWAIYIKPCVLFTLTFYYFSSYRYCLTVHPPVLYRFCIINDGDCLHTVWQWLLKLCCKNEA